MEKHTSLLVPLDSDKLKELNNITLDVNLIKLFFFVFDNKLDRFPINFYVAYKEARAFVPGKPFPPSLLFYG